MEYKWQSKCKCDIYISNQVLQDIFYNQLHIYKIQRMIDVQKFLESLVTPEDYLREIKIEFTKYGNGLIAGFIDQTSEKPRPVLLRRLIYRLTNETSICRPPQKVKVNKFIRENIQTCIGQYVERQLSKVIKQKQPHNIVEGLNKIWSNYQIFLFCIHLVMENFNQFFTNFHKMNSIKEADYTTERFPNKKFQVASIPTIGVNELKQYFQQIKLIDRFKVIFNNFLNTQRQGKSIPSAQIRESLHSLQACYFDMDTGFEKTPNPKVVKKVQSGEKFPATRHSTDGTFFKTKLLDDVIAGLQTFYKDVVNQKLLKMSTVDELTKITDIIRTEDQRANYYIHSKQNKDRYLKVLDKIIIQEKLQVRLMKQDGFKGFIEKYEEGKPDNLEEQIRKCWAVYSRVLLKSQPYFTKMFSDYLLNLCQTMYDLIKKPQEFISELIRINGKCVKIVQFCKGNFDLQNQRNIKIRGMLSNDLTEKGKKQGNYNIGARHLAWYVNKKFKQSYSKGGLTALTDCYNQLVELFKILEEKNRFIDQHSVHLANRLLEDVELSKDIETGQIITLEKNFIEKISRECGVSQVKELTENIKDIEKSIQSSNNLKTRQGDTVHPLNQLIVKNNTYWPEKTTYLIENPPQILFKQIQAIQDFFKKNNTNIQFEFNSGVSVFKGDFQNGKKQSFQFKNLYMMILLFIDEEKKLDFGTLKKKIESTGTNKAKGVIELAQALIELYYSGLIVSSTKSIKPGTPNICKISQTDEFEINQKYDFVEQQKKKKTGRGVPKPIAIVKQNMLGLSQQLKKGFAEQIKAFNEDEKKIEGERKWKVECVVVKSLKHAHHHQSNITFDDLYKDTQKGRVKEYRVNEKYLKEIIEELINKKYCERIEGQRNVFRYIA